MKRLISLSSILICISCVEVTPEKKDSPDDVRDSDPAEAPTDGDNGDDDEGGGDPSTGSAFQFTTCDKVSASTKAGASAVETATSFSPGEIITGVLDENDPEVSTHFWKINLPKGEYIMVLEAEKANNKHGNIMFDVSLIDAETQDEDDLIKLNEISYDSRTAKRFTAVTDRAMTLKIVSDHDIGTYKFAFFSPSTPIPQPRFSKCPETRDLVLGKKEVYEFKDVDGNNAIYFVGELEAGEYKVNLKSYTTDNDNSNVGARISQLAEASNEAEDKVIVDINEIAPTASKSGTMLLAKKQIVVIRAVTGFSDNGMELEIVKN